MLAGFHVIALNCKCLVFWMMTTSKLSNLSPSLVFRKKPMSPFRISISWLRSRLRHQFPRSSILSRALRRASLIRSSSSGLIAFGLIRAADGTVCPGELKLFWIATPGTRSP